MCLQHVYRCLKCQQLSSASLSLRLPSCHVFITPLKKISPVHWKISISSLAESPHCKYVVARHTVTVMVVAQRPFSSQLFLFLCRVRGREDVHVFVHCEQMMQRQRVVVRCGQIVHKLYCVTHWRHLSVCCGCDWVSWKWNKTWSLGWVKWRPSVYCTSCAYFIFFISVCP